MVVDDHPVVCEGVSLLVHSSSDIVVTGSARSADEAVAVARHIRPDVILLDLRLPDMLASEAVQLLRMAAPKAKIVIFTAYAGHRALKAAIDAGVDGCLLKDAAATGLSRNTVKTYLQSALQKLGARNRVEAIARASEFGLL